ncbi:MAG: phenylacetate--CoA ligase family protein [Deltaproteobacteria bacterium]
MSRFRGTQADRALHALGAFFRAEPALSDSARDEAARAARAEARVLALFREVAEAVPAYRHFLASHGIAPASITDLHAFRTVPPTTKDNYYRPYPLPELCRHGQLDACDMLALSTGSTGKPAVWPRFVSDELETAARFEQVLRAFAARDKSTLAVICFALGNWVGGMYTLACCRQLAAKGYPLTVVSPGNQPAEILRALRALDGHFQQRVLFGYPPFLKDVIELGIAQGIDWSTPPTRLVMAGEVFSEEWRDWVCLRMAAAEPARATASLYGTADGGVLANETPLSIRIRRALARRPDAARALFGEARLPTLCQYDPEHRYFELERADGETSGWLLFSGDGGAPLLRYKILDRGGLVGHGEMLGFLERHGVTLEPDAAGTEPTLPFVYVFGRSHFAVSFYGANVYPENVSVGLEQPELAPALTGKFVLEVQEDAARDAELGLTVELARGAVASRELAERIAASVRRELERLNSEFASYVPSARRTPRLELRAFGDAEYFPIGVKHRYTR